MMKRLPLAACLLCVVLLGGTTAVNAVNNKAPENSQLNTSPSPQNIPVNSMNRLLMAEMALNRSQYEEAVKNYILAAQETQDPKIAQRATQIALSVSSLETALEPALIWSRATPDSLEANITVAAILIRLQSHVQAANYLGKIEQSYPKQAFYHYLLIYRQLSETNKDDVLKSLTYLAKATESLNANAALAEISLAHEQYDTALDLAEKVLVKTPNHTNSIRVKVEAMRHTQQSGAATTFLEKSVQHNPDDAILLNFYVNVLIQDKKLDKARKQLEILLSKQVDPELCLSIARTAMEANWYDLAEKSLKITLNSTEHKDMAYYLLARLAELQENPQEAIQRYQNVVSGPFHVMSQIKASQLLSERKQYDEAIDVLINTQPQNEFDNKRIVLSIVEIYNLKKDFPAAQALLDKVIKFEPEDSDYLYARAVNSEKLGNIIQARADLNDILNKDPNNVEALNALGYILTVHTQEYDSAYRLLEHALKTQPNNASVLDSMGWLKYKMGKLDQALKYLQKAAEILPDAEIAAHLGEVLWALNSKDEARAVWDNALKAFPDDKQITEAMKRLDEK